MSETNNRTWRFPSEEWAICETAFSPDNYRLMEALFALSNGYLGQRSGFEEGASGVESLRGNYIAGVFDAYPNATMIVLKGRPTHPTQMVNIPDHLPVHIFLNGQQLDLSQCTVESYARTLQMDAGTLTREVVCAMPGVGRVKLAFLRFLPRTRKHLAITRINVTPLDFDGTVTFVSLIDGNESNLSADHLTDFAPLQTTHGHGLSCRTSHTGIDIALLASGKAEYADRCSTRRVSADCLRGETMIFDKIVAVATSRDLEVTGDPVTAAEFFLAEGVAVGADALLDEQRETWAALWQRVAVEITDLSGNVELTQGLHYSLFQSMQNASHDDYTVNIGAKGLTGEHYAGLYFWDTEIFMLPMFAFTLPEVARCLVKSRAHFLPAARRKAAELGLRGAMFPWMSDANGEEGSTLWQFSLLGIHVTADVAWSVWFYYCATGDLDFIAEDGIDIMVETSRFWCSRVYFRKETGKYVINRVLGPDEYHQGVDNNYYTNIMAQENLLKTLRLLEILREERPQDYAAAQQRLGFDDAELAQFRQTAENILLPEDEELDIRLQDDRFHQLEPYDLRANPPGGSVVAKWSYDRILRTQVLRQADIVVAHLLLGDRFTADEIRRDFAFYEPKTTHDSSLSFCSHAIIAAALGEVETAYDYFLRTARLDLDDLHGNSWMGVHTACLAGAWQCVVFGFGGVRWYDGRLTLNPQLPTQWESFSFSLHWHGTTLSVTVRPEAVELQTDGGEITVNLTGRDYIIGAGKQTVSCRTREMADL